MNSLLMFLYTFDCWASTLCLDKFRLLLAMQKSSDVLRVESLASRCVRDICDGLEKSQQFSFVFSFVFFCFCHLPIATIMFYHVSIFCQRPATTPLRKYHLASKKIKKQVVHAVVVFHHDLPRRLIKHCGAGPVAWPKHITAILDQSRSRSKSIRILCGYSQHLTTIPHEWLGTENI